ncbi:MAG TPA: AAA family ATPase [Syntrophales bacterium]|jgi:type II secretory pathway predicted ATPase ExeA|nr:AAA family ATPase [Syntrophobacterales bacterium]HQK49413.1 AAA family ATPase [Syntrophales bacterium]
MYLEYWGLDVFPYEIVPDLKFVYNSGDYREGMTRLAYAVQRRKGAALLTGDVGCGKTTLSRAFIRSLGQKEHHVGLITNPMLEPIEFIREILYQFGLDPASHSKHELLNTLGEMMMKDFKEGRTTVLVIDEAQLLSPTNFEEVRLLLNYQFNDRFLLNLLLIGQPELRGIVRRIEQLDSRIAIRYHLGPLGIDEMMQYVHFRLGRAGAKREIFTRDALEEIHRQTRGVHRRVNNLCDMCLLIGFGMQAERIDAAVARTAIEDTAMPGDDPGDAEPRQEAAKLGS